MHEFLLIDVFYQQIVECTIGFMKICGSYKQNILTHILGPLRLGLASSTGNAFKLAGRIWLLAKNVLRDVC